MTTNLATRWVIVGILWATAVGLAYWNTTQISVTLKDIEQEEIYRIDDLFWQFNSGKIATVLPRKDEMVLPVESPKLGFLRIENNLVALAERHRFTDILVESDPGASTDEAMAIRVFFKGPFPGLAPWLATLERQYPYLPVIQVKTTTDPGSRDARIQIQMHFRYRVASRSDPVAQFPRAAESAAGRGGQVVA